MGVETIEKSCLLEDLKDPNVMLELFEKDDNWGIWDMEGKVISDGYKALLRKKELGSFGKYQKDDFIFIVILWNNW